MVMKLSLFLSVLVFLVIVPKYPGVVASPSATHSVTVSSKPFSVISFAGTDGRSWTRLVIDDRGIVSEDHQLIWTTNCQGVRVAVQSNLGVDDQNFVLEVRATNLSGNGLSSGWVVIDPDATDLVSGIAGETGGCSLEYKASPKEQGNTMRDEHIITNTICAT